MNKFRFTLAGLALMTGVWGQPHSWAATSNANVGVMIISPADVSTTVATQVFFNSSTGTFIIRIPGLAKTAMAPDEPVCIATAFGSRDIRLLNGTDGDSLSNAQDAALGVSDGMLCGGQGVSLSLDRMGEDGEGMVVAVLAYN
jgi:hypothetical protein